MVYIGRRSTPLIDTTTMKILALEPYYGGSHKAFLDSWQAHSRYEWTNLTLAPYKWQWRMRHAALTFADDVNERVRQGESWDRVFCSDMLNLAEFRGLAPAIAHLPTVAYFHENQLTYPLRAGIMRDNQPVMTNLTTALAADQVWFNSQYHLDAFLAALRVWLKRMPDHQPFAAIDNIRERAEIRPPGIDAFPERQPREPGPMRILWAARWEHDKDPDAFFEAIGALRSGGVDFRISVIGEQFRSGPEVFETAKIEFADHIDRWGFQPSRDAYRQALQEADVFVSTAQHEFFGISAVEAAAAGAFVLLPRRLAYPEVFAGGEAAGFFYGDTAAELATALAGMPERLADKGDLRPPDNCGVRIASQYLWPTLGPQFDGRL
jgi:glycosyltransferase involved in cell wall biosynthesis